MRRHPMIWKLAASVVLLASAALAAEEEFERHNVLILIADDLGVDRVAAYGHRNAAGKLIAPQTPQIDKLASSGVLFRNAWAAPLCSPSRAMALTGKYPHRTGVGRFIPNRTPSVLGLDPDQLCLPDILPEVYASAAIGKWHVATQGSLIEPRIGLDHAIQCGFDVFRGTQGNLQSHGQSYRRFQWIEARLDAPGDLHQSRVQDHYATTFTTDHALETIREFGEQPWLVWVAYHAPHKPLQSPPAELIRSEGLDLSTPMGRGKAMIEALDTEIGRLLEGIGTAVIADTTVIFFGDNGTHRDLIETPFDPARGKGSVYSSGVNVPLIVSGGKLPRSSRGQECVALVDLTDLLPSVCELVGVPPPTGIDGHSFVSLLADPSARGSREWTFAERFQPNFIPESGTAMGDRELQLFFRTARDERYKLLMTRDIRNDTEAPERIEFYDLRADFHERNNLLDGEGQPPPEAREAFERLQQVIETCAGS